MLLHAQDILFVLVFPLLQHSDPLLGVGTERLCLLLARLYRPDCVLFFFNVLLGLANLLVEQFLLLVEVNDFRLSGLNGLGNLFRIKDYLKACISRVHLHRQRPAPWSFRLTRDLQYRVSSLNFWSMLLQGRFLGFKVCGRGRRCRTLEP